jgi:hypothetical protein
MTREEIEVVMRTDRKRYNKDPGMQARYRALLAQLPPGSPPKPPAGKPKPVTSIRPGSLVIPAGRG